MAEEKKTKAEQDDEARAAIIEAAKAMNDEQRKMFIALLEAIVGRNNE